MKTNVFFKKLQDYKDDPKEAKKQIKKFLQTSVAKETDTNWEEGAKNLFIGGTLYLLSKKKSFSLEDLKKLLVLDRLIENRREVLFEKFKTSPSYVQECFVGILDNAETTFKGFFGVLKNYVDMLEDN